MEDRTVIYISMIFLCALIFVLFVMIGSLTSKLASLHNENIRFKSYIPSLVQIHESNHDMFFNIASVLHGFGIPDVDKILLKSFKSYNCNCKCVLDKIKTVAKGGK